MHRWRNRLRTLLVSCKDRPSISKLHALLIVTGAITHGHSDASRIITSYASIGYIDSARKVFDEMPRRGLHAWNAMIIAYSRLHCASEALSLYSGMISEGLVRPDSSTYTMALKACAATLDLEMGEEIWSSAAGCGYENDVFVGTSVLNLYAKCGKMDEAVAVFGKMPRRDVVCCTTIIMGFLRIGRAVEAVGVYRRMQNEGMEFDGVVMMGLVQACASLGDLKLGASIHGCMIRRGIPMDVMVQTSLVDMYAKSGHLELACCVFNNMPYKNAVSWGALISGLAQNGFVGRALDMMADMQGCGFEPDSASLVSSLVVCSQVGLLKLGRTIHGYILRRREIDEVSGTAVIDMYSKCGSLSYARGVFDQMAYRDLILCNAMISSYGIHGHGEEALALFLQMTGTKLKPDHATFASLLSAFSHSGLVEEGLYWFDVMLSKYKIPPGEKHYACMVDLLARSGRVEQASELIASMNTKPGLAVWVALLAGCHNHRKLSIGEIAAKKVLEFDPEDMGVYALVSNFYAMAKKWDGVASMKKLMKHTGATKKVPGYSAVEVNGELHSFLMEDKSHHHNEEIMLLLDQLYYDMRALGYVPKSELRLPRRITQGKENFQNTSANTNLSSDYYFKRFNI